MNAPAKTDAAFPNANWSAFVLLVTLLSFLNSLLWLLPLPGDAKSVLGLVNLAISFILWADFIYLIRQSKDNRRFMTHERGWMVMLGSFPFLRFLRLLWFWLVLKNNHISLRQFLSQIVIKRNAEGTLLFMLFTVIVIFQFAVVAILGFEETTPGSNINSISDALWWAFTTVTTVGYGDAYPITNGGRLVGILLMAMGIALFSVITGSLADWFSGDQPALPLHHDPGKLSEPTIAVAEIMEIVEQQEIALTEIKKRLAEL